MRDPRQAFLAIERDGRRHEYFLGLGTDLDSERRRLDWRRAPLASVFFGFDAGEEFELELDDRRVSGRVLERALLDANGDKLAYDPISLPPRAPEKRRAGITAVVPLDPIQRAAVELPEDRSLLVLGEAGFGKTTVALHRLARLRPASSLVLVPTVNLQRLVRLLLQQLAVYDAEVSTFDEWITARARAAFRGLPKRCSADTPVSVIRAKRHPAIDRILPNLVGRAARTGRDDLLHLFGDSALVEALDLPRHAIGELLEHTKTQFSATTEREYAGAVDPSRLETLDGRAIDEGTRFENAETFDVEDAAILFELARLRGEEPRAKKYRHIIVDEAQELAPLELRAIGGALARGGTITVAGDARQQTDDTAYFRGWDQNITELHLARAPERVTLEQDHRCPPEVGSFARALIDGRAPADPKAGSAMIVSHHDNDLHRTTAIIDALRTFEREDPTATTAVICPTPEAARATSANLSRGLTLRLALANELDFRPGITVTTVAQVKGLEFDVAVVPAAEAVFTSGSPASKRALYVAITRALHRSWLALQRA